MPLYGLLTELDDEDIKESKVLTVSVLRELLVQMGKKKINYNYNKVYMLYQRRTKCNMREEQDEEEMKDGVHMEVAYKLRTKA